LRDAKVRSWLIADYRFEFTPPQHELRGAMSPRQLCNTVAATELGRLA
jgi:hypothetical protein